MNRTLILVDLQKDFMPGGVLPVPKGDHVLPLINRLQPHFDRVAAVVEAHPPDHLSFADNHPGRTPGDKTDLDGVSQVLWPAHCVAGTAGAEAASGLDVSRIAQTFVKGADPRIDNYSGFFDAGRRRSTGLAEWLRGHGVEHIYLCGLNTEHTIRNTALDGAQAGFRVTVIQDACRGVCSQPEDTESAFDDMRNAGVKVISSVSVLEPEKIICDDGVPCE